MFDSEEGPICLNALYDAGVKDNIFAYVKQTKVQPLLLRIRIRIRVYAGPRGVFACLNPKTPNSKRNNQTE